MNQHEQRAEIKVLFFEGSETDIGLITRSIGGRGTSFSIKTVSDEQSFITGVASFRPDVILSDYRLPGYDSLGALSFIREKYSDMPFILIAGKADWELAAEVVKKGASAVVLKDNLHQLFHVILGVVKEGDLKRKKEELSGSVNQADAWCSELIDNLPVGIFRSSINSNGTLLRVNSTAVRMLGYESEADMLKVPVIELYVKPGERAEIIKDVLVSGVVKNIKTTLRRKDGDTIPVSISASLKNSDPQYLEGIIEDMTNTTESDDRIEGYNAFLEILIDTVDSPVFYKDKNYRFIGCNRAFAERIIGLPREQITGKTVFDLENIIKPEAAENFHETDRKLFENPGQQVYERRVFCADRVERDFHISKATYPGPDGTVSGLVGIMIDITERTTIESELRRRNEEYDLLIRSMPSIIIGVSVKDRITQMNPYTEQLFGINLMDVQDRQFYECGIDWDWERVYEAIGFCIFEEKIVRLDELLFTRSDGKKGVLGLTINPLVRSGLIIEGFIILGKDLTEQKLLEGQLLQSRKLEAIGQLAAGVAHEINTPLQYVGDNLKFISKSIVVLLNILDIYQRAAVSTDKRELLARLLAQAEELSVNEHLSFILGELPAAIDQSLEGVAKVSKIVQSMKAFSHPGAGKKVPANINRAIENTAAVSRNEWKYDCELELDLDESLPEVPCLESELNQVLLNLIINAVDAIHDRKLSGEIEKGLIVISTFKEKETVIITIRDNGGGIPEDIRDRIFDPFFTTKEVGKGTGQGLPISFSIIHDKHGGSLSFETRYGEGTTFFIRLPLEDD